MPVTIKTIAEETGLSLGTVSQALRDSNQTSAKTRAKVRAVAEKLGYVPSDIGRALQAGKSFLIGYFNADITATYYVEVMKGLASTASENGYGILFASPSFDPQDQIRQIKFLEKKGVEGIVTSGCEPDVWPYLVRLAAKGLPVIVSDNYGPDGIPSVKIDDFEGGRIAAEHLTGLGHRNTLYFNPRKAYNLRREGFQQELKTRHLPLAFECQDEGELRTILRNSERPTAVFAYCDLDAIRVKTIASELNLRIPEDFSLIGFDDDVYSSFPDVAITTLRPLKQEIGRESMNMLLEIINGEKTKTNCLLKPELIIRKSTAASAAGKGV